MKTSVKVEGFKEIEKNLFRLKGSTAKGNTRRAMKEALEPTARLMRSKAPRLSGILQESVEVTSRANPPLPKRDPLEIAVGPGRSPQAIIQEFGSFKEPAQPYARPAWEEDKLNVLDRFAVFLWENVTKALGRQARKNKK